MTEIDFYTHVSDRLQIAARLCAKAYAHGKRVRVLTADEAGSAALDGLLWKSPPTGFLPHCSLNHRLAEQTPIIIDHHLEHDGPAEVLINLAAELPPFFSRFGRMMEIISLNEQERNKGRERFRHYRDRGYALRTHDLSQEGL